MSLAQYSFNWAASAAQAATSYLYASNVKPCAAPAPAPAPASEKTVIQNVTIWDGNHRIPNTTLVIEGTTISSSEDTIGATFVNGNGGFLMPGLINAHLHAANANALKTLADAGITTGFDLGSFPTSAMHQWHDVSSQGLTSLLFSGAAACVGPGFPAIQPNFPKESWINTTADATNFVDVRVSEGVDFLKIFIEDTRGNITPKQGLQQEIKNRAEKKGKEIISHAATFKSQSVARDVGGKYITHTPIDKALDVPGVNAMKGKKQVAIPTLIMMKLIAEKLRLQGAPVDYRHANASVALMHKMGVPILVGTDAAPLAEGGLVSWGVGIHEEMNLLVEAGMSNEDVLRGATSLTANYFNLTDRGVIKPGMRADLLLLSHDPLVDMYNSDTVVQIWTAGTPVRKK